MATFGPIASGNPNVLFDPAAMDRAAQSTQRNALMQQYAQEDRRASNFDRDRTHVAEASAYIHSLPEAERPAAYATAVQELQRNGIAMRAPKEYPGHAQIAALAQSDLTSYQRAQLAEKRAQTEALAGLVPGGAPMAPPSGSNPLLGPLPGVAAPPSGGLPPPGAPGRYTALEEQRGALLDGTPQQLAEASAARGATGAPQIPGGYRSPAGLGGAFAGLAPPSGVINPNVGGAQPAAQGAAQVADLRRRAAQAAAIGSPAAQGVARQLEAQAAAIERTASQTADDTRADRTLAQSAAQQAETNKRADAAAAFTREQAALAETRRTEQAARQQEKDTAAEKAAMQQRLATVTQQEAPQLERIATSSGIIANGDRLLGLIKEGKLEFGTGASTMARVRNATGFSSPNSVNFADLERHVTESVNAVLAQASGPQTDQDANRARDQILNNLNDKEAVKRGLEALNGAMARARQVATARIQGRRKELGLPDADLSPYANLPPNVTVGGGTTTPGDARPPLTSFGG